MTHLEPGIFHKRPRAHGMRSAIEKHLHHTQHMLLAAMLASLTIVVVAATMMSTLF